MNITTTSYAVLITSTTDEVNVLQQHLVVAYNDNNLVWSRTTNGGRGESNAWNNDDYNRVVDSALNKTNGNHFIVGEVLSSPLTNVDTTALDNNERPIVLIQKLTKQFGSRQKTISNQLVDDVITDIDLLIKTNPALLEKYRADGRKEKTTMNNAQQIAPQQPAPIVQIVREQQPANAEFSLLVPTHDEVGHYIPRVFNGISESKLFDYAITNRLHILLEGSAGTGKTTSPMHYGYQKNLPVSVLSCSMGLELGHFIGKTIIKPNGEAGWIDGILTHALRYGGIVVLDEVDFAQPKILQRLQDVLQNHTLTLIENNNEVIKAHPNFLLVATYNRTYKHSNKLNEAFLDRFKLKLYFDYDNDIEKQLIKSDTLLELADKMRADSIAGIYSTPISLRILLAFQQLAQDLNYEFAVENLLQNFIPEERSSVKLLLEAHRYQLEEQITGKVNA